MLNAGWPNKRIVQCCNCSNVLYYIDLIFIIKTSFCRAWFGIKLPIIERCCYMPVIVLLVDWVIECLIFIILFSSMLSLLRVNPRHPLFRLTHSIIDPLLQPISAILPSQSRVDFSPMIAVLILWLLQLLLHNGS